MDNHNLDHSHIHSRQHRELEVVEVVRNRGDRSKGDKPLEAYRKAAEALVLRNMVADTDIREAWVVVVARHILEGHDGSPFVEAGPPSETSDEDGGRREVTEAHRAW